MIYEIVLIGNNHVGKTSFIERLASAGGNCNDEFKCEYHPSTAVDARSLMVNTNRAFITFKFIDGPGNNDLLWMCKRADACIVMFDLTNQISYDRAIFWTDNILVRNYKLQVILCGNKLDLLSPNVYRPSLLCSGVKYYEISVKDNFGVREPMLNLARQLTGINDLNFINSRDKPIYRCPTNLVADNHSDHVSLIPLKDNIQVKDNTSVFPLKDNIVVKDNNKSKMIIKVDVPDCESLSQKKVQLMQVPGGRFMKVTCEFYRDGDVIEQ